MTVSLRPAGYVGGYRVLVDGEEVGQVRKRQDRFNIAPKAVTLRWWSAVLPSGTYLSQRFGTRREAVAALVAWKEG